MLDLTTALVGNSRPREDANAVAPEGTRTVMSAASRLRLEQRLQSEAPLGRSGEPDEFGEPVASLARYERVT